MAATESISVATVGAWCSTSPMPRPWSAISLTLTHRSRPGPGWRCSPVPPTAWPASRANRSSHFHASVADQGDLVDLEGIHPPRYRDYRGERRMLAEEGRPEAPASAPANRPAIRASCNLLRHGLPDRHRYPRHPVACINCGVLRRRLRRRHDLADAPPAVDPLRQPGKTSSVAVATIYFLIGCPATSAMLSVAGIAQAGAGNGVAVVLDKRTITVSTTQRRRRHPVHGSARRYTISFYKADSVNSPRPGSTPRSPSSAATQEYRYRPRGRLETLRVTMTMAKPRQPCHIRSGATSRCGSEVLAAGDRFVTP